MGERHFSPEDVEALIPVLTEIMRTVMALHGEHGEAKQRLHAEQQRISLAGGGILDREAWRRNAERVEAIGRELRAALERIVALGGVPKDLSLGLVDFPHVRERRVVNLCWKYGERRIEYWHGLDEGYAARKPL